MTSIESRSYSRVVVIAPSTRIDLALPADVAVIDLLPMLLQYAGELRDDGGGVHGGWKLVRVGHGELDGGRTLRSLDVADGEVLRLEPRESRTVTPVFDDIVDAIASTRRDRLNVRSVNPGLGAGVIVATFLVAAYTLYLRGLRGHGVAVVDAYIAGGIALAALGLATAIAQGYGDRIMATALAAGALPFTLVCGLSAVSDRTASALPPDTAISVPAPGAALLGGVGADTSAGHWGVLLGAAIAFVLCLAGLLALGTGTIVFAAAGTVALFTAISALIGGLAHVDAIRVMAGTIAVAIAAFSVLPRLSVRLARLPFATVPTSGEDLEETDDIGDIEDVTARARLAGEYLTAMQIGLAVVVAFCAIAIGTHLGVLAIATAATAVVAMALRARSVASLGGRLAMIGLAALAVVVSALIVSGNPRIGNGIVLLVCELGFGLIVLVLSTASSRRRVSPQTMRLVDFLESGVLIAVLPLAVGVMGLYDTLRHL